MAYTPKPREAMLDQEAVLITHLNEIRQLPIRETERGLLRSLETARLAEEGITPKQRLFLWRIITKLHRDEQAAKQDLYNFPPDVEPFLNLVASLIETSDAHYKGLWAAAVGRYVAHKIEVKFDDLVDSLMNGRQATVDDQLAD